MLMGRNYKHFVDVLYPVLLAQHRYDARGQRLDIVTLTRKQSCQVVAPIVFGDDMAKQIIEGLFPSAHLPAHNHFVKKLSTHMTGMFKVKQQAALGRYDQE